MGISSCTIAWRIGGLALACLLLSWNQEKVIRAWDDDNPASNHVTTKNSKGPTTKNSMERPSSTPRRSPAINFGLEPEHFVGEMASCIHDSNCRIYYLHFQKSGGTDVENRMFNVFPPKRSGCCGNRILNRFHANITSYCLPKFSSYQVSGNDFLDTIVPGCMAFHEGGRAVLLMSYREPIQRTLSEIHQVCNKNWAQRANSTKDACLRCSYEQDKDFWNENFVENGVNQYKQLQRVANTVIPNANVLTIDTADLYSMYSRMYSSLNHSAFQIEEGRRANPERKSRCDFAFPSEMMRGLKTAEEVYRNLTMGFSSL